MFIFIHINFRSSTDANYYIKYSSTRDGIQIGSYGGGQLCTLNGGLTEIIGWTKDNVYLNKPTVIAGDLRTTGRTYIGIDNPGGGGGDTAYLEYVSVGSDQTTLRLAVGNDSIGAIGDSINLTATGGVGVGIDTPAYSLDVNGNGHFSSSLQVDGVVSASNNQYITNSISTSTFNSETLSSAGTAALIYTCSVTSYSQQMNFTIPFCCYMTGSYGSSMLGHVKLQPNSFSCTVNRDGIYYTSPSVSSSVALSSVYTQMQVYNTGTFTGEQYMCTLSFSFIPAVSNNSSTYTFYLTPTWTTTVLSSPNYFTSMTYGMYLNTTLSTNTKSATGTAVVSFDSTQGTGYVASNFSTTFVNIATGGTNIMDQVKCNKLSATNGLSTDLGYYNYNTGGGGTAQNISMPAYGTYMVFIGHNYNDNNIAGSFMLSAYGGARVFNSYLPPGFNLTVTAYSSQGFTVSASYPSGYTSFLVTYLRLA